MSAPLTEAQRTFFHAGAQIFMEKYRQRRSKLFYSMFPDEDVTLEDGSIMYARHKYAKHMEFFAAGLTYRERCFMAGNRVGKTWGGGGYEMTAHLTGKYPEWWEGRKFTRPIKTWAAGKTNSTTRDILQATFLGDMSIEDGRRKFDGTGIVPGDLLGATIFKTGLPDLVDTVRVRHSSGGWSVLGFKSYQQGRGAFEGTAQHAILLDEEPPADIYGECLIRTMTTNGIILLTFTPLEGLTEVVLQFMPQDKDDDINY